MVHHLRATSTCLFLGLANGCAVGDKGQGAVAQVLEEIGKSQVGSVLWELIKGILLGGLSGLILAIVAFLLLRKWGAYRWGWTHARWFRLLTLVMMVILLPIVLGFAGFVRGVARGSEIALRESQIGTELLPKIANFGADLLDSLDQFPNPDDGFVKGTREFNVVNLDKRLEKSKEQLRALVAQIFDRGVKENPDWKGALAGDLLLWGLERLHDKLRLRVVLEDLVAEAAKKGDPKTIAREDLSHFLTQRVLVPTLLQPLHSWTGSTQKTMLGLALAIILLPIGGFQLAEWIRKRSAKKRADKKTGPTGCHQ